MEEKYTEINIPKVKCDADDKKMLARIRLFKVGAARIIIFIFVGFIIGWFGYTYTTDSFIVTKVIFAIPYKISEVIYISIIGTGDMLVDNSYMGFDTIFFKQSMIATFLAEHITPVLVGGAIFGALAYFTGDKKVFTLNRFIKFFLIWSCIILVYIGCVYGVNAKDKYDNNHLNKVDNFFLIKNNRGDLVRDDEKANLVKAFESGLKFNKSIKRNEADEKPIGIILGNGLRLMMARINYEECYLVTTNGRVYSVSKEFVDYVK